MFRFSRRILLKGANTHRRGMKGLVIMRNITSARLGKILIMMLALLAVLASMSVTIFAEGEETASVETVVETNDEEIVELVEEPMVVETVEEEKVIKKSKRAKKNVDVE